MVQSRRTTSVDRKEAVIADKPPIRLLGPDQPVFVLGREKSLTPSQYNVIQTLEEAWPGRLDKRQLAYKSGHMDARRILSCLAKDDDDWNRVISFPEKTGGGYGLVYPS